LSDAGSDMDRAERRIFLGPGMTVAVEYERDSLNETAFIS
jgi:hypothetical protein